MEQEYLFLEKQPILAGTSRLSIYTYSFAYPQIPILRVFPGERFTKLLKVRLLRHNIVFETKA